MFTTISTLFVDLPLKLHMCSSPHSRIRIVSDYTVIQFTIEYANMVLLFACAVIQDPNASVGSLQQQSQLVTLTGAQSGGGVRVVFVQPGQTLQQQTQSAYINQVDLKTVLTQGALQQGATSVSVAAASPAAVPTPQPRQPPTPQAQQ